MKKLWTIIFALLSFCASAQVEKGKYFVGGSADINVSFIGKNSGFNLGVSPNFGVVVVRGLVVGARYSFNISSAKNFDNNKQEFVTTTTYSSAIGALFRYYPGKKQLKGVIVFNPAYLTSTTMRKSSVSGTHGFALYGAAGIAYFVNDHISIETLLYANISGYKKVLPTTRIGLSVGIFVFLDKKKKEEALPKAE